MYRTHNENANICRRKLCAEAMCQVISDSIFESSGKVFRPEDIWNTSASGELHDVLTLFWQARIHFTGDKLSFTNDGYLKWKENMNTIYKVTIETIKDWEWSQWFTFQPTITDVGKAIQLWKSHRERKIIISEILAHINSINWENALNALVYNCKVEVASVQIGLFSIKRQKALVKSDLF